MLLPEAIFRADPSEDRIYLTYDDGPDPEVTPQLLEILAAYGVLATFFVLPSQDSVWSDLIRKVGNQGHGIALHGLQHRSGYLLSNRRLTAELNQVYTLINRTGVRAMKAYRPPFGHIRPDTVRFLKREGFRTVLWSKITGDFRQESETRLFRRTMRDLHPGDIIVLHDGTRLCPPPVLPLTRMLLDEFRRRNWHPAVLNLTEDEEERK